MKLAKLFSKQYLELKLLNKKFKKLNPETKIRLVNKHHLYLIESGKYSFGVPNIVSYGGEKEKLIIGNYCSIAAGATFILSGEHYTNTFTTYTLKNHCFGEKKDETLCKGPIKICDDVWIGYNATILSGITIGQGAIVGANSLVTKNVEPYSIVGGNPAKFIKYRYSSEIIEEMKKIDFSKIEPEQLKFIEELVYKKLDIETLKKIKEHLNIV